MNKMNAKKIFDASKEFSSIIRIDKSRCEELAKFINSHEAEISSERKKFLDLVKSLGLNLEEYKKKWDKCFLNALLILSDEELCNELMEFALTAANEKAGDFL